MIYLNNAATTWPKPEIVYETVDDGFRNLASPGRTSGGIGQQSATIMQTCRAEVAEFFNISNPERLLFVPTCTYALNLAILGQEWRDGDVVLMSGLEHHAVARPVRRLAREQRVSFELIPYAAARPLDLDFVRDRLRQGRVKMVAVTMASNVTGDILPVVELGQLCREFECRYLVDAAQAAGIVAVDVEQLAADFLAVAGHKGVFGPPGTGALYVREGIRLASLTEGGTGRDSGLQDKGDRFPSAFEVGTHNLLGIIGLTAGVRWLKQVGLNAVRRQERLLTERFLAGLQHIPDVKIYGTDDLERRTAVVSLTMRHAGPQELANWLADEHGVVTRAGYHCAPLAHETIGTLPGAGTIRFSFGFFNTPAEVDEVVGLLAEAPRLAGVA